MTTHQRRSNEQCYHNQGTCLLFNASPYQYSRTDLDQICYEMTSEGISNRSVVWDLYSSSSGLSCFAVLLPQTDDTSRSASDLFLTPVSSCIDRLTPYPLSYHYHCMIKYRQSIAERSYEGLPKVNRSQRKVKTNSIVSPENNSYVFTPGMMHDGDIVIPEKEEASPLDWKCHHFTDSQCRCRLHVTYSGNCRFNSSCDSIKKPESEVFVTRRSAIEETKSHFAIEQVLQQLALLTSSCKSKDVISQSSGDTLYSFCVAKVKNNQMLVRSTRKSCSLNETLDDLRMRNQRRDLSLKQKTFNTKISESTDSISSLSHSLHCSAACSLSSCHSSLSPVYGTMKIKKAITLGLRLDKVTKQVYPCYKVYSITDEGLLPASVMEAKRKGKTSRITIREVINEYLRELEKFGRYQKIGRNCSDFAAAFINLMSYKSEAQGKLTGGKLMCEACQRWVCRHCC